MRHIHVYVLFCVSRIVIENGLIFYKKFVSGKYKKTLSQVLKHVSFGTFHMFSFMLKKKSFVYPVLRYFIFSTKNRILWFVVFNIDFIDFFLFKYPSTLKFFFSSGKFIFLTPDLITHNNAS